MYIREPILGHLTQGVIFNCATAERYPEDSVHGIIITARCDLAHDKIPLVTYLPIVKMEDWLAVDGSDVLEDRARKDFSSSRTDILKTMEIAPSIAESQTVLQICDAFFPAADKDKANQQKRQKLLKLSEVDEFFRSIDAGGRDNGGLYERFSGQKKIAHQRFMPAKS